MTRQRNPTLEPSATQDLKFSGFCNVRVESEDRGFELVVDQCTGEGTGLAWHWKNLPSRNAIREKSWNYVVLQDRSGGPLEEPDSFRRHAGNFYFKGKMWVDLGKDRASLLQKVAWKTVSTLGGVL